MRTKTDNVDKKIVEFPDRERVEAEAAEWIVRLDNDRLLNPEELQRFRKWLANPMHRNELTALNEFWSDQSLAALPIPLERLCYEAALVSDKKSGSLLGGYRWLAAVAATIFSAVLISNISWWDVSNLEAAYATAIGQQRTLDLPDGSILYLNTNSQVKVEYSDNYRNINLLQGEAHFEVAKDKSRPFRVYAGRGRVEAIGTAFTVLLQKDRNVDVVVSEGTVALAVLVEKGGQVAPSKPEVKVPAPKESSSEYYLAIPVDELGRLEAGQETTILVAQESEVASPNQLDSIKQVAQEELERRGAWRSGLLVFSGDSLEDVVKEISRYTTLSIDIVDPELKTVRIGGRFSIENTTALFDALEANFGLKVTQLDYNHIQISSAENNNANKK